MLRLVHQSIRKKFEMDLITDLKKNIDSLERLFLGITENYPETLSFLENHITKLNEDTSDSHDSICVQSSTLILNEHIESFRKELINREANQIEILQSIESIKNLSSNVEQNILIIQDESLYLELLSLNAMVSAIKSGKNGGAFPFLTKEMQKLSILCHKKSDSLLINGKRLQSFLSEVEMDINRTITNEENSLDTLNDHAQQFLLSIKELDDYFNGHLQHFKTENKDIKKSTYGIISELQKHDIIRQSLDHIILSIQFSENLTLNTLDDELDYLKFSKDMYQFSSHILQEVIHDLSASSKIFEANYNKINSSILSLEINSEYLQRIEIEIHDIQEDIQNKNDLEHSSINIKEILKTIENLSLITSDFSSIMKQMKMVNISNRIEYSRNPNISGLEHIINDIEQKSKTMEFYILTSKESFQAIHKKTLSLFSELNFNTKENQITVEKFKDSISSCLNQFNILLTSMNKKHKSFQSFLEEFRILSLNIKKDLLEIKSIVQSFSSLAVFTEQTMIEYECRLNALLKQSGHETWSLKNVEVHKIIDKFTILTHKKSFTMESENEIEQGACNGEIVLF